MFRILKDLRMLDVDITLISNYSNLNLILKLQETFTNSSVYGSERQDDQQDLCYHGTVISFKLSCLPITINKNSFCRRDLLTLAL